MPHMVPMKQLIFGVEPVTLLYKILTCHFLSTIQAMVGHTIKVSSIIALVWMVEYVSPVIALGDIFRYLKIVFTHARNRTPALSVGPAEVINNITYNGREGFVHHNVVGDQSNSATSQFNIIGNQYVAGPNISLLPFWFDPENSTTPIPSAYWLQDNWVEDPGVYTGLVQNPWNDVTFNNVYSFACCGINANQFNQSSAFDFSTIADYANVFRLNESTLENHLLPTIGAYPHDIVARQSILELQQRNGSWRNFRPVNLMDGLTTTPPPIDSDDDGMPDDWENENGLNPQNGSDHNTIMPTGYTAIETYINGIATQWAGDLIFKDGFE